MIEELHKLGVFWDVGNQYDLLNRRWLFRVRVFDGEPCISGGVGEVSGWKEVDVKAETVEQAIAEAIKQWNA